MTPVAHSAMPCNAPHHTLINFLKECLVTIIHAHFHPDLPASSPILVFFFNELVNIMLHEIFVV